jgi:hypothetical protein
MMYPHLPIPSVSHNYKWTATLVKTGLVSQFDGLEIWTFSPDFSQGLQGNVVDEMFTTLFPKVGNRGKTSSLQAFKSALLVLAQAASLDHPERMYGFIHNRTTQRTGTPSRYKDYDFSTTRFTKMLDELVEHGFVSYHKGFNSNVEGRSGLATLWFPASSFNDWLSANGSRLEVVRHHASIESIILRDEDKKHIDYPETLETEGMRQRVESSNALRLQSSWAYYPLSDDRQFEEGSIQRSIPATSLICKRNFKGDLKSGGRFYCGAQHLRKAERDSITVDGHASVELDYKSLHPRLLYNAEKLEAPTDCYASDLRPRELTKVVSLFSINCKSFDQARRTLMTYKGISSEEAISHLKSYAKEHYSIAHRFFVSGWRDLQYLDSQLVDAVLAKATAKSIPVLPVHDSFIVSTEHTFWLKEAVEKSYRELMGFDAVIDWEPMPDIQNILLGE